MSPKIQKQIFENLTHACDVKANWSNKGVRIRAGVLHETPFHSDLLHLSLSEIPDGKANETFSERTGSKNTYPGQNNKCTSPFYIKPRLHSLAWWRIAY